MTIKVYWPWTKTARLRHPEDNEGVQDMTMYLVEDKTEVDA